jgi:hypothetical protein
VTHRPLLTPQKDLVPILHEAEWVPGPVWRGAENLVPTGIRSPDRPTCSQSLYRLRYPAKDSNNVPCLKRSLFDHNFEISNRKIGQLNPLVLWPPRASDHQSGERWTKN